MQWRNLGAFNKFHLFLHKAPPEILIRHKQLPHAKALIRRLDLNRVRCMHNAGTCVYTDKQHSDKEAEIQRRQTSYMQLIQYGSQTLQTSLCRSFQSSPVLPQVIIVKKIIVTMNFYFNPITGYYYNRN